MPIGGSASCSSVTWSPIVTTPPIGTIENAMNAGINDR